MAQGEETAPLPDVGTRISLGFHRGTIRYVGDVAGTKGTWLGVEWDDASRGKHSGTHNGIYYFACRISNAASFIRPSAKLSYGSSFLQALQAKYVTATGQQSYLSEPGKSHTRRSLADIEIEVPNMASVQERTSQLHRLREVGLGGWRIDIESEQVESSTVVSRAYDSESGNKEGDIQETCPKVRGLDLSRSLLPSWNELSRITRELPLLESLQLHFNRFAELSTHTLPLKGSMASIRDLRMDGMLIKWREMLSVSQYLPMLEVLQIGNNAIGSLSGAGTAIRLHNLRTLNLEGNDLVDWEDVWLSMIACPTLERLILSSNRISSIRKVVRQDEHINLKHISLWSNPVRSWEDIDNLNKSIGGIQSLVLGGDGAESLANGCKTQDLRTIAIARLTDLGIYNNVPIRPIDRRDAELYYISMVAKENSSDGERERERRHPRWSQLCQIHGRPETMSRTVEAALTEGTLRSKLLTIKVHLSTQPPSSTPPFVKPGVPSYAAHHVELKLLTTTPLKTLSSKMARSFGLKRGARSIKMIWALLSPNIDPAQVTASFVRDELRPGQSTTDREERIVFEMDSLERDLHGYNFSPGDEIVLVVTEASKNIND